MHSGVLLCGGRKGSLAREIERIVDKNLPVDDEIEERREKQIAAVAYEYFKGFVASLQRKYPQLMVGIGVQQARSWGDGPYGEAQTLAGRNQASWRKGLPNMFLVRCWEVYSTTYTPKVRIARVWSGRFRRRYKNFLLLQAVATAAKGRW